jgi:hypothetical protein
MTIQYRGYGEVSYGDNSGILGNLGVYTFPPTYTSTLNSKPVISGNGYTSKYIRNELTINWILPYEMIEPGRWNPGNSPVSVDTAVKQIKAILMQPRQELTFTNQGLGEYVGVTGKDSTLSSYYIDKAGGPTPLDFKWKVLATQRCVEMSWTVAFHTDGCIRFDTTNNDTAIKSNNITDFSWSRTFDYDDSGLATITTTGVIERSDYGVLVGKWIHIDEWRVKSRFLPPTGFKRISQKFQHDPTTRIMNFTIIDKEVSSENAYPPYVVDIDLSHEMSSALTKGDKYAGIGYLSWNNTFSGSITLSPGVSPLYAYFLFHFYLRQRMNRVSSGGIAFSTEKASIEDENGEEKTEEVRTLLTRISYKESLFTRTHTFKAEYWALYSRDKFIKQSGLFLPLYNYAQSVGGGYIDWNYADQSDYEPWHTSFNRSQNHGDNRLDNQWFKHRFESHYYLNPYGYRKTKENLSEFSTLVYFPCNYAGNYFGKLDPQSYSSPEIGGIDGSGLPAPSIESTIDDQPNKTRTDYDTSLNKYKVDPAISWVDYQANITLFENCNTVQVVRQSYDNNVKLGLQSFLGQGKPDKDSTKFTINNGRASGADPPSGEVVSTFNGQSNTVVVLSGYAVRAGYPVPMPSILSYKGNAVYRAGQSMYSNRIISKGEVPIYLATWSIPYYIDYSKHADIFADLKVNGYSGDLG